MRTPSPTATATATAIPTPTTSAVRFDEAFLRKLEVLAVVAKRARGGHAHGERRGRRAGGGIEFADHREYAPGDDVRALDWNLFARLDRPFVRVREDEEDLTLRLIVDGSASMAVGTPPKLELAVRIAAALAHIGLAGLDQVGLALVGAGTREVVAPLRGRDGRARLLSVLEGATARGRTDLAAAARDILGGAGRRRRALTVLISDLFDPAGWVPAVDGLRSPPDEVVVVQITGASDGVLPPAWQGDVILEDAETGEERAVTITPAVRAAHAERYATMLRAVAIACRERGVRCFQIAADVPFEDAILRILRGGGLVA